MEAAKNHRSQEQKKKVEAPRCFRCKDAYVLKDNLLFECKKCGVSISAHFFKR